MVFLYSSAYQGPDPVTNVKSSPLTSWYGGGTCYVLLLSVNHSQPYRPAHQGEDGVSSTRCKECGTPAR